MNQHTLALAVCICVSGLSPGWAQKNNRNDQQEKRENQRVAEAHRNVRDKQERVKDAEQKLRNSIRASAKLEANVSAARTEWRQTREQVADDLAKSLGIQNASAELQAAKTQQAEFSKPILERLHRDEAWIKARQQADQAKLQAEKAREDIEMNDAERNTKLGELAKLIRQPDELDNQAILGTAEGRRLDEQVNKALAAIAKIRQSIPDEKIDSAPSVVQAKLAIDRAEQAAKQQAQQINAQRGQLRLVQQELLHSRQRLQQAQAADARDKNRK